MLFFELSTQRVRPFLLSTARECRLPSKEGEALLIEQFRPSSPCESSPPPSSACHHVTREPPYPATIEISAELILVHPPLARWSERLCCIEIMNERKEQKRKMGESSDGTDGRSRSRRRSFEWRVDPLTLERETNPPPQDAATVFQILVNLQDIQIIQPLLKPICIGLAKW